MDQDGKLYDETSVEVDGIFEGVAARMDSEQHNTGKGVGGARYRGSIDPVTAHVWAKECGAKMFSKEWMAHAKKKIESGDFSKFFPTNTRRTVR